MWDTAPAPSRITYKVPRSLDDTSHQEITDLFNDHWRMGILPGDWKHAQVYLIHKQGKFLLLQNLRPISLTSCEGKLLSTLLSGYYNCILEAKHFFPETQFVFRPNIYVQDIPLQMKNILSHPKRRIAHTSAILGLDILKARIWQYVNVFLEYRTA